MVKRHHERGEHFAGRKGSGERFEHCVNKVGHRKGVHDAKAVCAAIGRKKYGAAGMSRMARRSRK